MECIYNTFYSKKRLLTEKNESIFFKTSKYKTFT